jgi:DNA (cytosine-5)-methyltransferase 1
VNYYNENNFEACAWLRELIRAQQIPDGFIDQRSIEDVRADDLLGYAQCHFFAGIGGWALALRLAEWPDDEPVWTGSCPCQPLSCAGQRKGHADKRHLWPALYRLISKRQPATIFGEQVAKKDGREWLAGIRADLEGAGYAVGASDLCAAGLAAPHIRQRLYWVANAKHAQRRPQHVADQNGRNGQDTRWPETHGESGTCGEVRGLVQPNGARSQPGGEAIQVVGYGRAAVSAGRWSDSAWHKCRDGKSRRISPESALFPLAYGIPGSVGLLRGYGNAIVPQLAAEFIQAACESVP